MESRRNYKMSITDGVGKYECSIALLKVKGRFILPPEAAKNKYHINGSSTHEVISKFNEIVMSSEWGKEPTIKATSELMKFLITESVTVMGIYFPSTPGEGNVYWMNVEFFSEKHTVEELTDLVIKGLFITNREEIEVRIL